LRCPLSLTDCICTDRNWKQQISGWSLVLV
jgi:hypothetical protein